MADQVLIIDDDTRLSAMLSDYLSQNGFRVRSAATAMAASFVQNVSDLPAAGRVPAPRVTVEREEA